MSDIINCKKIQLSLIIFLLLEIYIQLICGQINVSGRKLSRNRRSVTVPKSRIWDNGIVPYEIDATYFGVLNTIIKQAMRHWENYTCIKFVERNIEIHPNYVMFTEKPCGCCSNIGKRSKGKQYVSINDDCNELGYVAHELGHSIGFYHEHTRPDRDEYVQINFNNIEPGSLKNFEILSSYKIGPLNQPYDYDSIMHYASDTFANNNHLNTIVPKQFGRKPDDIGQRVRISKGDVIQANILYDCPKCGATYQTSRGNFSSSELNTVKENSKEECEWRISVAHGSRVMFFLNILDVYKSHDCKSDYIKIIDGYSNTDPILGVFCGKVQDRKAIISTGNRMLIKYRKINNDNKYNGFTAKYESTCDGHVFLNSNKNRVTYLESPNYPDSYFQGQQCIWRVSVDEGCQVTLKFHSFNLQHSGNNNLNNDSLEIRDGHDINSPIISQYYGTVLPPDYQINKKLFLIKFVSNRRLKTLENIGFSVSLTTIKK